MLNKWYIGLDQSSSNTGIAATNGRVILTSNLIIKAKLSMPEKLMLIEDFIRSCCEAVEPAKVYTEAIYSRARLIRAFTALLKVETTIHNYLFRVGYPYETMSPNHTQADSWPRKIGVRNTKDSVRLWLLENGQTLPKVISEHELDALGVLFGGLVKDDIIDDVSCIFKLPIVHHRFNDYPNMLKREADNLVYSA
jgi:hypothetical protein